MQPLHHLIAFLVALLALGTCLPVSEGLPTIRSLAPAASPLCGSTCVRRLLYQTAYASASTAVEEVMDAYDSYGWCIHEQDDWCPDVINSTLSGIAGEAAVGVVSSLDARNCGDQCLISALETVSTRAALNAMVWAERTINGTSAWTETQWAEHETVIEELRWTMWRLSSADLVSNVDNAAVSSLMSCDCTNPQPEKAQDGKPVGFGGHLDFSAGPAGVHFDAGAGIVKTPGFSSAPDCSRVCPVALAGGAISASPSATTLPPASTISPAVSTIMADFSPSGKPSVLSVIPSVSMITANFSPSGTSAVLSVAPSASMVKIKSPLSGTISILTTTPTETASVETAGLLPTTPAPTSRPSAPSSQHQDHQDGDEAGEKDRGKAHPDDDDDDDDDHDLETGLAVALPLLGAGAGMLAPYVLPAACIADPVICAPAALEGVVPYVPKLLKAANEVLNPVSWFRHLFHRSKSGGKGEAGHQSYAEWAREDENGGVDAVDQEAPKDWHRPHYPATKEPAPEDIGKNFAIDSKAVFRAERYDPRTGRMEQETYLRAADRRVYSVANKHDKYGKTVKDKDGNPVMKTDAEKGRQLRRTGLRPYYHLNEEGKLVKWEDRSENTALARSKLYSDPDGYHITWQRLQDLHPMEGEWRRVRTEGGDTYVRWENGHPALSSQGDPLLKNENGVMDTADVASEQDARKVRFDEEVKFRVYDKKGTAVQGPRDGRTDLLTLRPYDAEPVDWRTDDEKEDDAERARLGLSPDPSDDSSSDSSDDSTKTIHEDDGVEGDSAEKEDVGMGDVDDWDPYDDDPIYEPVDSPPGDPNRSDDADHSDAAGPDDGEEIEPDDDDDSWDSYDDDPIYEPIEEEPPLFPPRPAEPTLGGEWHPPSPAPSPDPAAPTPPTKAAPPSSIAPIPTEINPTMPGEPSQPPATQTVTVTATITLSSSAFPALDTANPAPPFAHPSWTGIPYVCTAAYIRKHSNAQHPRECGEYFSRVKAMGLERSACVVPLELLLPPAERGDVVPENAVICPQVGGRMVFDPVANRVDEVALPRMDGWVLGEM